MLLDGKLEINGRTYPIEYIYVNSRIAKAIVEDGKVIIKVPTNYPDSEKEKAIRALKEKIARRLMKDPEWGRVRYPNFYDGQALNIMNRYFVLHIIEGDYKRSLAKIEGSEILIKIPKGKLENKQVVKILKRLLAKEMLGEVSKRVDEINKRYFNFEVKKVTLRYASERWGSCNAKTKTINLNFLLLFAPEEVFNYVIVHELAHLKELNHSARFWELVRGACPNYKEITQWLNKNKKNLVG